MSNENNNDNSNDPSEKKTLSLGKSVGTGTVRQSFSHGRSKAVVVEKRKRRFNAPADAKQTARAATGEPAQATPEAPAKTAAKPARAPNQAKGGPSQGGNQNRGAGAGQGGKGQRQGQRNRAGGGGGQAASASGQRNLTSSENAKRLQALEAAKSRAREMEIRKKEDEARRIEEDARRKIEEEAKRKAAEEAAREKAILDAQKAEEEKKIREAAEAAKAAEIAKSPTKPTPRSDSRPARTGDRPAGNRPARTGERPAGARPGGGRPGGAGDRPAGNRPAGGGRPGGGRPAPASFATAAPDPTAEGKPGAKTIKPVPKKPRPEDATRPEQPAKPRTDDRRRGKLTLSNALNENERQRSLASMRRRRAKQRGAQNDVPREKVFREVIIPETITVQELAQRMTERAVDVIKILMKQGQMVKTVDILDADTAQLVAEELGHAVKRVSEADVEEGLYERKDSDESMEPRPPVVTIMGHVDHGKTSLLDALRHANVVKGEAGGITQHIGAYQVEQDGQKITFIDTPGHAAFTEMRARGAKSTDIVILVVAADDGVMPQTIEAINHARAAEVPIIVAVNKMDLPAADPSRVRNELLQHGVFVETMGGDVLEVEVSALKQTGLDTLLEAILIQSEMLELKANPDREADGVVVEAKLDKGRGPVATVLVQHGTLNVGDIVVAGEQWGKVRALVDDLGDKVDNAGPSKPVEILGFSAAPDAGDQFAVVQTEGRAREIADYRIRKNKDLAAAKANRGSLEQMLNQLKDSDLKTFPLVIKGDVKGSVEAIIGALDNIGNEEVSAQILHSGVGGVTESDVTLAEASGAPIIAFNVRANAQAKQAAEQKGVEIRYYNIIYDLTDDVKSGMSGLLSPEVRETFIGYAEILEVFNITKVGKVAGCRVTEGVVERGTGVRLLRDNVVIHTGKLSTLKRFKDEVKEVVVGQECGMAFEKYEDLRAGDRIECFRVEEIARSL
ncbi:translation initiation factor IF-2 [Cohaesibacter celericrescens]|uniref:Translation initiation factor IF-2 n=1 Tax=Cohaesibacter celericrescens TaxID=2067669 RepID=A0A2N5XNW9_9HYPH|nr:translation initiation factor IF-2 [Cohaesibacter celericrescens]PLW76175.1 translation initiation factor IF-2 [Cohaesibacter celericrescens]